MRRNSWGVILFLIFFPGSLFSGGALLQSFCHPSDDILLGAIQTEWQCLWDWKLGKQEASKELIVYAEQHKNLFCPKLCFLVPTKSCTTRPKNVFRVHSLKIYFESACNFISKSCWRKREKKWHFTDLSHVVEMHKLTFCAKIVEVFPINSCWKEKKC